MFNRNHIYIVLLGISLWTASIGMLIGASLILEWGATDYMVAGFAILLTSCTAWVFTLIYMKRVRTPAWYKTTVLVSLAFLISMYGLYIQGE